MRPKTTAKVSELFYNSKKQTIEENKQPELKKDTSRSKSAIEKDVNQHAFYSRSWRIHSELHESRPDPKKPIDNTQMYFYHTTKKQPETFIFRPDWV